MMRQKSPARVATLSFVGLAAAIAASTAAKADDVKMGYINKMGEHPWFVSEVAGAKAEAGKLGVNLMTQDVQFDANLALTTFDTMVGDGVTAIAVDDDIVTSDKKMVPYVGMNAETIGRQVGAELAKLYKAQGWDKFSDVRIGSIEDQKADTCMRRNRGAEAAFLEAAPSFDKSNIVRIPYDNHMESAVTAVTTTLTAHPEAKHWIFYSCNDDGVLGGVRATENQGFAPTDVIGIGIDGSRACDAFGSGRPTGFRGTMYIDSAKEGAQAIELLYASVKNDTALPGTTYVNADLITADTFGGYKDKLCHK